MSRGLIVAILVALASSGSVKVDDFLAMKWRIDEKAVEFTLEYQSIEGSEVQWWSVALMKDSNNQAEVFLLNSTGLDSRFALSDSCASRTAQLWHEVRDKFYLTAFTLPLSNSSNCLSLVHGDLYHVSAHYGEYRGDETVETKRGDHMVPLALTNQYTDQEDMTDTLNYAVGVACFLGILYIAA